MALSVGTVKDNEQYARILLYGAPGVGKTTWAASAPNPVILDYENSAETLRNTPLENTAIISNRGELAKHEEVLRFLKNNPYDTIIIDSASSMNDTLLMEHMKNSKRDKHIALFADFRKINNVLKEIFYTLIDVPKNVIVIAHEAEMRDPETNKVIEIRPLLPPEAKKAIIRLVNEVYYLEKKPSLTGDPDRLLHVDSQGKIVAKNRRGLNQPIKNSNWKDIYQNG